ncbi:MAG: penicillin-binding protein 2 [Pseudonocardiaceae bacterium]|nr:penicillin-binding protein 2 [Pseudonocardiaceae bacterium]
MNTPLRKVALAMMGMVVLLLANATYIQMFTADDYRSDPRNRRVLLNEYSRERGQLIAGGLPLASSVPTGGELQFQRRYLDGPLYAPLTGYYSLRYGSGGMENAMNSVLNGSDGRLFVRRLSDLITGRDPRGGHVELTADPAVQQAAFEELASRDYSGAVVALRPGTGEVLGMASTPSYDPNRLASFDAATQEAAWEEFTSEENGVPLRNRAVSAIYPPGSTFKLVTTAAALESGTATPDTQLTAAPSITLDDTATQLQNYAGNRCGSGETAPLTEALARSCNTAFAQLAAMVGEDALRAQAEAFGIGEQDLRIPLPVAPSTIGDIPDTAALQVSGIGQRDVALTPLQNAVIAATIANDGVRMAPEMVRNILAPDFSAIDEFDPQRTGRAMSGRTAEQITQMMIQSEEFTGGEGQISGVTIASKTGTAEHGADPETTAPHVWYVAFAPADDPQVAVAVVVENGGDGSQDATGGSVAAPIGRAVIAAALRDSS